MKDVTGKDRARVIINKYLSRPLHVEISAADVEKVMSECKSGLERWAATVMTSVVVKACTHRKAAYGTETAGYVGEVKQTDPKKLGQWLAKVATPKSKETLADIEARSTVKQ